MPKDLFSEQSDCYAKYRPGYPSELFYYILEFVKNTDRAWDCATGNGQAAKVLADHFEEVEATDISEAQISKAVKKPNIHYRVCPAEKTPFSDNSFDLITVATAYHWLNWKHFHDEATRVAKPGAVVAIWAYNLLSCDDDNINRIIQKLYYDVVHEYWEYERKFVETDYNDVEFKFDMLPSKEFSFSVSWSKEQFVGYLQSWSAVRTYIQKNNISPLTFIEGELDGLWVDGLREFHFPLFLKMGRVVK